MRPERKHWLSGATEVLRFQIAHINPQYRRPPFRWSSEKIRGVSPYRSIAGAAGSLVRRSATCRRWHVSTALRRSHRSGSGTLGRSGSPPRCTATLGAYAHWLGGGRTGTPSGTADQVQSTTNVDLRVSNLEEQLSSVETSVVAP
jgi:hypothetical protein